MILVTLQLYSIILIILSNPCRHCYNSNRLWVQDTNYGNRIEDSKHGSSQTGKLCDLEVTMPDGAYERKSMGIQTENPPGDGASVDPVAVVSSKEGSSLSYNYLIYCCCIYLVSPKTLLMFGRNWKVNFRRRHGQINFIPYV